MLFLGLPLNGSLVIVVKESLDSTHTWDSELSLNLRSLIDSNYAERTVRDRLLTRGPPPNLGFLHETP